MSLTMINHGLTDSLRDPQANAGVYALAKLKCFDS